MGKLSVMIGDKPTGLSGFVEVAKPAGIYMLNNRVSYPGVQTVYRVQNETWGRLPDACAIERYFETEDPEASAVHELLGKKIFVVGRGDVSLIEYWMLTSEHFYAPYNEWVLGEGPDAPAKASWMNRWNIKAIEIASSFGLKLCLGSFNSGEPDTSLLPLLYGTFRALQQSGGIMDWHEYGVDGPLQTGTKSGALRYRLIWSQLPSDCKVPFVISEFWGWSGFTAGSDEEAQIQDAIWYGTQISKDPYVLWASAFQLDEGAESHITPEALTRYAELASEIIPSVPPQYPCVTNYGFASRGLLVPPLASSTALAEAVDMWQELETNLYYSAEDLRHMAVASDNHGFPAVIDIWEPQKFPGGKDGITAYFADSHALLAFHMETEPPPASLAWKGLHMRADGHSNSKDFEAFRVAGCNAAKIMTNTSFEELYKIFDEGVPNNHVVLRLFAAGDNPSLRDPEKFVEEQSAWLREFDRFNCVYVEVHNEPNLAEEGLGYAWNTPQEFGDWFGKVASLIHLNWPNLEVGWPGLSPQPNVPEWIPVLDQALKVGSADWVGAHAYWTSAAQMDHNDFGRYYRRFLGKGAPVIVTEFSNNKPFDSDLSKGQQYKQYYATLEFGVFGAFAFVSSASNPVFNNNRETWVRNNVLTDIPGAVA